MHRSRARQQRTGWPTWHKGRAKATPGLYSLSQGAHDLQCLLGLLPQCSEANRESSASGQSAQPRGQRLKPSFEQRCRVNDQNSSVLVRCSDGHQFPVVATAKFCACMPFLNKSHEGKARASAALVGRVTDGDFASITNLLQLWQEYIRQSAGAYVVAAKSCLTRSVNLMQNCRVVSGPCWCSATDFS